MEPYRPFIDAEVVELQQLGIDELDKTAKAQLIGAVLADVKQDGKKKPHDGGSPPYRTEPAGLPSRSRGEN
jgi:hypothetical protein